MAGKENARSLEETPTWAVAVVCFVLVSVSIFIEHLIHIVGKWLQSKNRPALVEALEKFKAELVLMGFISLLLPVVKGPISNFCIPESVASTWHPCSKKLEKQVSQDSTNNHRRLLQHLDSGDIHRRSLATAKYDKCAEKGKVAFVSAYGIHQLHIFIFVLAITHVLYCIITYVLGNSKMRKWRQWEDETKTIEYQYHNDTERFRFASDTSFGQRHLKLGSQSPIFLWIVCFFRQFFGSVTKVDYLTLRHGFIMAHLAPGSERTFDFQKYIRKSLEEDFKVVVGITPVIWFIAVLFLLSNTYGWHAYLWLPFIPLIIILVVGTKLQVIITRLGLRIQERGDVVMGTPVVQPGDDFFWFGCPRLILFLIHLVLFQNAFQIAFFMWSVYEFTIDTCLHKRTEGIVIGITMGVIMQVLSSCVTLPLYALVTKMGSSMRPTVFNDRVAMALRNWHHTAKKHAKHSEHSDSHTPMSSRPATPTHSMSPVHLLHNYCSSTAPDSLQSPPRISNYDYDHWDPEDANSVHDHEVHEPRSLASSDPREQNAPVQNPNPNLVQLPPGPGSILTQHEIYTDSSDFTFQKQLE